MKRFTRLKFKLLCILMLFGLIFLTGIETLTQTIVINGFQEIENDFVQKNAQRLNYTLNNEVQVLARKIKDWSNWDDSYHFLTGENNHYVSDNLNNVTFENLNLYFFTIWDGQDNNKLNLLVGKTSESPLRELSPAQLAELKSIVKKGRLTLREKKHMAISGLVSVWNEPIILTMHRVTHSDMTIDPKNPVEGYIVVGQRLDAIRMEEICKIIQSKGSLVPLKVDPKLGYLQDWSKYWLNDAKHVTVEIDSKNHNTINGLFSIKDLFGTPRFLAKVQIKRHIHQEAKNSVAWFFIGLIVLWGICLLCLYFLLDSMILSRLKTLSRNIQDINNEQAQNEFKIDPQPDEIGELSQEIENMLSRIYRADTLSDQKSEFLANMSHEIRTPLNAIMGMAQLMEQTPLEAEQRELLDNMTESGSLLLTIINDILDVSRIEAGRLEIEKVPVSIQQIMDNLTRITAPKVEENSNLLHINIDPDIPAYVISDPVRLQQILLNLINNAIKFTHNGHIRCHVTPSVSSEALHFCVSDTGVGIAKEHLPGIFDKFTQEDKSTTRRFGGSGLGLAICKQLVSLMGGQIGVESHKGQGTSFWFEIPLEAATNQMVESLEDNKVLDEFSEMQIEDTIRNANLRILLAEDNRMNQTLMTKILDKLGIALDIANNGLEALEYLDKQPYDVILMDCQMPFLNGYDTSRRIRQDYPQHASTAIIALTANALEGEADKCLAAGMDAFMSKPFRLDDFKLLLLQFVNKKLFTTDDSSAASHFVPDCYSSSPHASAQ